MPMVSSIPVNLRMICTMEKGFYRTDGTSLDGVWKKNKFIHANGGDRRKKEVAKKTDLEKSVPLPVASGTGFYVSEYGHLVTNNHVVQGCNEIKIHFGESIFTQKNCI